MSAGLTVHKKLSGMTGTASTEAPEFSEIYKLDVVEIPTNKPLARIDHPDLFRLYRGGQRGETGLPVRSG